MASFEETANMQDGSAQKKSGRKNRIVLAGTLIGQVLVEYSAENEEELKFLAELPSGRVREFQGLYKFQCMQTGNDVLLFTNVPKRLLDSLKLYASTYDPLQWRASSTSKTGLLDLGAIEDPRDWDEVFELIEADGETTIPNPVMDATHVALPKESLGLLAKARALMGL